MFLKFCIYHTFFMKYGIYHTYSFNYKWFIKMNESMILVFYS